MIATIKFEWRKLRLRPAFLVSAGLIAALPALVYLISWYQALHPTQGERGPVNILTLYPDQFVNQVIGAGTIGGAIAIVLGAIYAGSEFSWGTLKTMFTQRPGRLSVWAGRVVVFFLWMAIIAAVLFVVGAAMSVIVALFQGHSISWPAAVDIAKGFGAIWLILVAEGAIGFGLGVAHGVGEYIVQGASHLALVHRPCCIRRMDLEPGCI